MLQAHNIRAGTWFFHALNMKPSLALEAHRIEIREIFLEHRALNARVFGSVAHGSDSEDSDLDILVDTTPDTSLFDLGAIRYKLRNLLGVSVDVLTPAALPDKFRHIVMREAIPV
jgi:predicted nucleotidyltransferase